MILVFLDKLPEPLKAKTTDNLPVQVPTNSVKRKHVNNELHISPYIYSIYNIKM